MSEAHKVAETITELRKVSDHAGKDRILIRPSRDTYIYEAANTTADDGNLTIKPDDILPAQAGRWVREIQDPSDLSQPLARHVVSADQLLDVGPTDWAVNAPAPLSSDSIVPALPVRRFDDTAEEGVGFLTTVPTGAGSVRISFKHRAQTAPGGATTVAPKVYSRKLPHNAAPGAWSAGVALATLPVPANAEIQYGAAQVFTLAALGLVAGELALLEITRVTGGLVGDWTVSEILLEFVN